MSERVCRLGTLLEGVPGAPPEYLGCRQEDRVGAPTGDSRAVVAGGVFIALSGAMSDGHAFIQAAFGAGARVAVLRRGALSEPPRPSVLVDDTAAALPVLAANFWGWPGRSLRLAAITGTNGKTTVSHLVGQILAAQGSLHARLGTTGNHIVSEELPAAFTTPFPPETQALLARAVQAGATCGVMEASSHALEQGRLEPLRFATVALTSFSQDHLDYHGTMDAYLRAKLRLPETYLEPGGLAVALVDRGPAGVRFLEAAARTGGRTLALSGDPGVSADLVVRSVSCSAEGTIAWVDTPTGALELRSPLPGAHNLENVLVALGVAIGLGVPWGPAVAALATARGAPGRLQRVALSSGRGPVVLVDYAHTPDAVERVLGAMRPLCRGRLTVVLGCGGDRDRTKRPRMGALAARCADRFFATSDNPRTEDARAILAEMLAEVPAVHVARVTQEVDRGLAIDRAIAEASTGDIVLLLGKGHEDYQILGSAKIHFDDCEQAMAALTRHFG